MNERDRMNELPPEMLALLERERSTSAVPNEVRESVRANVERSIGAAVLIAPKSMSAASKFGVLKAAKLVVAMAVVSGGVTSVWVATHGKPDVPSQGVPAHAHATRPAHVAEVPRVDAPPTTEPEVREGVPQAVVARPATPPPVASDDALSRERALLDEARTALAQRHADRVLVLAEEHARTFRFGRLVQEREALAIQALVVNDQLDEARRRAALFRRLYPSSLLSPVVDNAVGVTP